MAKHAITVQNWSISDSCCTLFTIQCSYWCSQLLLSFLLVASLVQNAIDCILFYYYYSTVNNSGKNFKRKVLFPEFELVTETEPDDSSENYDKSEEERLDEYKHFVKTNAVLTDAEADDKELESLATLGKETLLADKQFRKFKKRVAREPKQVCNGFYFG